MDLTAVITMVLVIAVLGPPLYSRWSAHKAARRAARPPHKEIPGLKHADACLIYCYNPARPPGRTMTVQIDKPADETGKVFKFAISSHPELAPEIGIRATPPTLVVAGAEIPKVIIGVKSPAPLLAVLGRIA